MPSYSTARRSVALCPGVKTWQLALGSASVCSESSAGERWPQPASPLRGKRHRGKTGNARTGRAEFTPRETPVRGEVS